VHVLQYNSIITSIYCKKAYGVSRRAILHYDEDTPIVICPYMRRLSDRSDIAIIT